MPEPLNAVCAVCGKAYHVCNACRKTNTRSWRMVTDTVECYQIYMIVHDHTYGTITGEKARDLLASCALPAKMQRPIKTVIDEIMSCGKTERPKTKKGITDRLEETIPSDHISLTNNE